MVEPVGIAPTSSRLQRDARTSLAKVPSGGPPRIRTETIRGLKPLPPTIGLEDHYIYTTVSLLIPHPIHIIVYSSLKYPSPDSSCQRTSTTNASCMEHWQIGLWDIHFSDGSCLYVSVPWE